MDTSWMMKGKCVGVPLDTFFPYDSSGVAVAQRICVGCSVRGECLEYALENHLTHGIWGGTSERQRLRIARARRRAKAS